MKAKDKQTTLGKLPRVYGCVRIQHASALKYFRITNIAGVEYFYAYSSCSLFPALLHSGCYCVLSLYKLTLVKH